MTVVSALVAAVALVALVGQAVRGTRTVDAQLAARAVHDASVDDAFYACIDTQAHSLVRPGPDGGPGRATTWPTWSP